MLSQSTWNWRVGILLATTPLLSESQFHSFAYYFPCAKRWGGAGKRHAMRERESGGTEHQTETEQHHVRNHGAKFHKLVLILLIYLLGKIRNFTCIFALLFGSEERYADYMNFRPHSMEPIPLLVFRAARNPRFPSILRTVIPSRFIFCIIFFREAKIRETERRRPHTQLGGSNFRTRAASAARKKKKSKCGNLCVPPSRPFHPFIEKCNLQEI